MEIGLFQLENLRLTGLAFRLLDLRQEPKAEVEALSSALNGASSVQAQDVPAYLAAQAHDKHQPVVLLCETGQRSAQVASQLETAGYTNIYVIQCGITGLLSEL